MNIKSENVFLWPIRVYYEDTDAGGVVYHANYLKFMERARSEWLRSLGIEQDELRDNNGVIFAILSAQVDYLLPAKFNDELFVSSEVIKKGKASITIEQDVLRETQVLCKGIIKVATLDGKNFRPKAMPDEVYRKI